MKQPKNECPFCEAGIPVKTSPPSGRQWVEGWIGEKRVYFTLPTEVIERIKEVCSVDRGT